MNKEMILSKLPYQMVDAIEVLEELHNAPFELSLQAVLAVANFAAQKHYDVETYLFGIIPISEFFIALAHSGGAKSTIYKELMQGIQRFDEENRRRYKTDLERFQVLDTVYNNKIKRAKILKDEDKMERRLEELIENCPHKPIGIKHLIDNPTLNGIAKAFEEVPDVGLFTAEAGVFLNSWGFQDQQRGMEMATKY